ncbi:MAG TPA: hypothetical protein VHX39_00255 [Acetobacteraceae bacterium]|jgi:hypothetical protein|nr:hypothetical protein [Acetobacteraceae bacterium]
MPMKPIPLTRETRAVARRVVWFETPAEALADPIRFMAYAMAYATHEDMKRLRRHVSDEDFREALDHAPPGIIDPRSWAYWNLKMDRYPPPPLPRRRLASQTRTMPKTEFQDAKPARVKVIKQSPAD